MLPEMPVTKLLLESPCSGLGYLEHDCGLYYPVQRGSHVNDPILLKYDISRSLRHTHACVAPMSCNISVRQTYTFDRHKGRRSKLLDLAR
jgi:hypothetical protein